MAEPTPIGGQIRDFDELNRATDEVLRQIAARVHIIDLAYAFFSADSAVRDRLLGAVRPSLAQQIESAIKTVEAHRERIPPEEQVATARARVISVAREVSATEG